MREIKFRAWDKEDKKIWLSPKEIWALGTWFDIHCNCTKKNSVIFMQYTGLKDRRGIEIYEGDVLLSSYTKFGHKVIFANGSFKIKHSKKCCPPYKTSLSEASGWQEIIGNIYENPELLKGE